MSTIGSLLAMFFPLFIVMYIANMAERQREQDKPYQAGVLFCYLLLGLGFGAAVIIGLILQGTGWLLTAGEAAGGAADMPPEVPFSAESLPLLALGVWLPGVGGLLLLIPAIRRALANFIPIDPANPVHTVALAFVMLVLINLMMTLGIGLGNLAELMENGMQESMQETAIMLWVQQILMALLAFVGVGWLVRRNLQRAMDRLALSLPTWRQSLLGFALGVVMVPVVLITTYLASLVGLGVDPDVERLTEQMIGPLFESPLLGILTIGLAAALGEELLFRGALQPRLGLVLTSAVFALVHSNYGISISTVMVFILGLLLGWVRIRYNTSTAMILHAVYNMTLGILATLSISFLEF